MEKKKVILGVVPTKRPFLSMEEAKRQKDAFMAKIRSIKPDAVTIVDIDDICENGILFKPDLAPVVIEKLKAAKCDALFTPFCDFGDEESVARVAAGMMLPTLVWGNRDERPNNSTGRGRDTQCGMFASTKVMARFGVKYSYIWNCSTDSEDFAKGYERFIRVAMVLKTLKSLRVAKIGERPGSFFSVMTNDANLITRFGITCVPVSPFECAQAANKLIEDKDPVLAEYTKDLLKRFDTETMQEADVEKAAALKLAIENIMRARGCEVGAFECWSAFPRVYGSCPCVVLGDMADCGLPLSCETDVNGAITLAILQAANLYEESPFLADLTIRNPENDDSELLWHCGPFPYSLKADASKASLVRGQEQFELKQGHLTIARFDDLNGEYTLFCGEGDTTTGPETTGTYVYFKADNWKRWEEKLMFGPYIHHVGGVYGDYLPVLREVARYLGIHFDNAHEQGIYSL
ncbi:MAG: hypothetical protein IJ120_01210 [Solobacterium sp.]|nr:hypothetical protein [Solobacterium sp.]